jgi:hypothetical protein
MCVSISYVRLPPSELSDDPHDYSLKGESRLSHRHANAGRMGIPLYFRHSPHCLHMYKPRTSLFMKELSSNMKYE